MVFEVLAKMLQAVYQSDFKKLCQSNIKEYNAKIWGAIYPVLVFPEKKIKMLKTAFVAAQRELL